MAARLKLILPILVVLLICGAVYLPSLRYHFVGDDYLALNAMAHAKHPYQAFDLCWPAPVGNGYFRPGQWLPYLVGSSISGLPHPHEISWAAGSFLPAYHLLNLFFHLLNVILVYYIASAFFSSRILRALAALVFAVHPAQAEAVCWIAAFGDVGYAFFLGVGAIFFHRFNTSRHAKSLILYGAALLSFSIALCFKESAVCFIFLVCALLWFQRQGVNRLRRFAWLGFVVIAGIYCAVRGKVIPNHEIFAVPVSFAYFIHLFAKLLYYVRDLVAPVNPDLMRLVFFHPVLRIVCLGLMLIGVSVAIRQFLRFKEKRTLIFLIICLGVALLVPVAAPFAPARRHLYFPLAIFSFLLLYLVSRMRQQKLGICLVSLFIFLEIITCMDRGALFRRSGRLVQQGLAQLQEEFPNPGAGDLIALVGIPGTIEHTPCFWPASSAKVKFLYAQYPVVVKTLSVLSCSRGQMRESALMWRDARTVTESIASDRWHYIRVPGEEDSVPVGEWAHPPSAAADFMIVQRDSAGSVAQAQYHFPAGGLNGVRQIYYVTYRDARVTVIKHFIL